MQFYQRKLGQMCIRDRFHTEIGQVMEMLRVSGNKQIMTDLLANNPLFEKMSRDAAVICNELLGLELKIEDKEVVNLSLIHI